MIMQDGPGVPCKLTHIPTESKKKEIYMYIYITRGCLWVRESVRVYVHTHTHYIYRWRESMWIDDVVFLKLDQNV